MRLSFILVLFCGIATINTITAQTGKPFLTEIMFNTSADNSEFIEIYNSSEAQSVDLSGWKIKYQTSSADEIIPVNNNSILKPNAFAVIFEGDYDFQNGIYKDIIPDNALMFVLDDNAFGRSGMANSSGRTIYLINQDNDTVSVHTYSADNDKGISDEKININETDNDWSNSLITNGTPGAKNSVSPKEKDLGIIFFSTEKNYGIKNESINTEIGIKNFGTKTAENFSVSVFNDFNRDSVTTPAEMIKKLNINSLSPGDSVMLDVQLQLTKKDTNTFIAELNLNDELNSNNREFLNINTVTINEVREDLVVNEIMYDPDKDDTEWIEVFNKSKKRIDLKNYQIADNKDMAEINFKSLLINPEEYFVVAKDSSILTKYNPNSLVIITGFPTLNNTGDDVVLLDSLNRVIDSVSYKPGWGEADGISLERIAPDGKSNDENNWKPSIDTSGATPGKINSVSQKEYDLLLASVSILPELPKRGDDVNISASIKNIGRMPANFKIILYKINNNEEVELEESTGLSLTSMDSLTHNFNYTFNDINREIIVKITIVYPEDQFDFNNSIIDTIKPGYKYNSLVINEIMFNPNSGNSEWIEFANTTETDINLKNWKIENLLPDLDSSIIIKSDYFVLSGDFVVLVNDSIGFNKGNDIKIIEADIGTLGNIEDGIMLYDFNNILIDSVFYKSKWGGDKGRSIERIELSGNSNDNLNWGSSLANSGSTPGEENSVINISTGNKNDLVINEIMYEPNSDNSEYIEVYNRSGEFINIGGWKLNIGEDNIYELINRNYDLPPYKYFVIAADSNFIFNYDITETYFNLTGESALGLKNDGAKAALTDYFGNVIDSLYYYPEWHNRNILFTKNKSLERINPDINSNDGSNWSTSANTNGGTPGEKNSIFTKGSTSNADINISPNPFSPDNDGFEDFTVINYNLSKNLALLKVTIYDDHGRKVRTLVNNQLSGTKGKIIFDGLDDDGRPLRIGIYILFMEAYYSESGKSESFKKALVIARK